MRRLTDWLVVISLAALLTLSAMLLVSPLLEAVTTWLTDSPWRVW